MNLFNLNIMKNILSFPICMMVLLTGLFNNRLVAQAPPQVIADSLQSILDNAVVGGFTHPVVIMKVSVPGEWSWSGASGHAISGQTAGQPLSLASSNMKFRVGSITKNMVAACILKLEQDGLLNINNPIGDYLRPTLLNDTIQSSLPVTIRQLLNHMSGIANAADNTSCQLNLLSNLLASHTLEEAVFCGASLGEQFAPGTNWEYSNTNYSLLAMIIEEVSGMSYSAYLNQVIIQPLNLQNTEIPSTPQITGPHMGCYWNMGSNPWTDLTVINATAYTGWADVVSTTDDVLTYYAALRNGTIINATELAIMHTIDPLSYDYGMGIDFYYVLGSEYVGHYGEVGNTSGMFFGDITSTLAPNGYYISYNFKTQGANMQSLIDVPVMKLLKNYALSIDEIQATTFEMSPNPASNSVEVNYPQGSFQQLRIFDLQGREVYKSDIVTTSSQLSLEVSELKRGTYFVTLWGSTTKKTQTRILK